MIAGAEAGRIGRALESVACWTSEIIVVLNDDVSDGTDRLAENHGAKVFRESWKGYMAQKNSAAAKATQPWLLGLDADEAVSETLRDEITRALSTPAASEIFAAFSFPRCTRFCGRWIRHGDWYPDRAVRLWRKGHARWTGAQVHEKLEVSGHIGKLRADLLHDVSETVDRQIEKIMSYSNAFLLEAQGKQRPARWWDLGVRPCWRFVRSYVLRGGFLDGWQGWYIAWMTAFYTATRYAKVRAARADGTPPAG